MQPMQIKSIDWFLYEGNFGVYWVKFDFSLFFLLFLFALAKFNLLS